ncbi:membrane protease YdiL (CAAX protease family) [Flavobacterium sp. 2755]|uniref:superinfection immunity protein n=1 Tax=Flavobacterium sp. 2755 TaxID=2817765 RepID=UPI00285B4FDD|nr:superinfection immunity protein [Flavobacterium sp. 2755]MDR6762973.1 membrane protease YdiL (CAAX protease family) [Flavobacterium sp. 2755]
MKRKNIFIVTALISTIFVHGMQIGESSLPFENNDITVGKLMAGMVVLFVYFIPTIICWKKRNSKYLLILNILVAWTILGWFICFIWAFNINRQHAKIVVEEKRKRKEEKKKIKEAKIIEEFNNDKADV